MKKYEELVSYFSTRDLDIRKTKSVKEATGISPRFMDQKCTPDLLEACAVWILNLPQEQQDYGFFTKTIWDSTAFSNNVRQEFSKPDVKESTARSEFDKFIAQPLKTFAYAGILETSLLGNRIKYRVVERELLQQISLGPRQARAFLIPYLEATLKQSGVYHYFEAYFDSNQTLEDYIRLRDSFVEFILAQTFITQKTEIRRIFPKVLNPLAHNLGIKGSVKGRVSQDPIMTSELLYNRENFRDEGKSKRETRRQAAVAFQNISAQQSSAINRIMGEVRARHNDISELQDAWANGQATQVHHIFPRSQYPALAAIPENLILLTPTQHNTRAHPRNNTHSVDFDYQVECLFAKVKSVRSSIESDDGFYKIDRLIAVINTGYPDLGIPQNSTANEVELYLRVYQNLGSTVLNIDLD